MTEIQSRSEELRLCSALDSLRDSGVNVDLLLKTAHKFGLNWKP